MDFTASAHDGQSVCDLMRELQQWKDNGGNDQVVGGQQALLEVLRQVGPVLGRQGQGGSDCRQPEHPNHTRRQERRESQQPVQKYVRIPQRQLDRQWVPDVLAPLLLALLVVARQHFCRIGARIDNQQVLSVELPDKLQDFILRRRLVGKLSCQVLPHLGQ